MGSLSSRAHDTLVPHDPAPPHRCYLSILEIRDEVVTAIGQISGCPERLADACACGTPDSFGSIGLLGALPGNFSVKNPNNLVDLSNMGVTSASDTLNGVAKLGCDGLQYMQARSTMAANKDALHYLPEGSEASLLSGLPVSVLHQWRCPHFCVVRGRCCLGEVLGTVGASARLRVLSHSCRKSCCLETHGPFSITRRVWRRHAASAPKFRSPPGTRRLRRARIDPEGGLRSGRIQKGATFVILRDLRVPNGAMIWPMQQ